MRTGDPLGCPRFASLLRKGSFGVTENRKNTMPEGITAENLLNNIMDSISDGGPKNKSALNNIMDSISDGKHKSALNNIMDSISDGGPKHKSASFFQEESENSVSAQFNRLFGRQKPLHHCLGGGKSADIMLWKNKKISAGVLISATAIWVLFEWLNYNLLSLVCFGLSFGLIAQFVLKNASGVINRSPSNVPRLVLPNDLFINTAKIIGAEINRGLGFLQDAALGGNLKHFGVIILSLWIAGMLGSWCNFLTVLYIGFVAAHTLPVLYEKYEDEIDNFVRNTLEKFQGHYKKMDSGVLSRIPRGSFRGRKHE